MAADTDHFDALDALADTHQKKLAESLVTLENRIADLVATAPLQDGKLFDLEWAVNARNELRQAISEDYLTQVDSIIRDYDKVAVDAATMLSEYGDIAQLDGGVVSQLQKMTYQGFEDLGAEHLDIISKQVYESTLTGATFANSVNAVREAVGGDMARYASQQVHDSLMQFDRAVNTKIALDSGAEKFKYRGSDDSKTRTFCAKHVDKVYTIDEINEIWQGEWAGKSSSNAFATAGGYNCRHRFRPVFDDELEEEQVDEQDTVRADEFVVASEIRAQDKGAKAKYQKAMNAVTAKQLALQKKIDQPKVLLESTVDPENQAFYRRSEKLVFSDPEVAGGAILRHEYGHHIDYELATKKYNFQNTAISEADDGFVKAFESDRRKNKLIARKTKDDAIRSIKEDIYDVKVFSKGSTMYSKEIVKDRELGNFSDIIDALTHGYMGDNFGGYAHGSDYFKDKGMRYKESFANLYALRNTPFWESHVMKYTPAMGKRFDELIDEALD